MCTENVKIVSKEFEKSPKNCSQLFTRYLFIEGTICEIFIRQKKTHLVVLCFFIEEKSGEVLL